MPGLLVPRRRPELLEVRPLPPVRQNAGTPQVLELQARDVPARVQACRLLQEGPDRLDLVLQRPRQRVDKILIGDRGEVFHATSKHENEMRTRGNLLGS